MDMWGRPGLDFVAKFERLNDDFFEIAERLGILSNLEHKNQSERNKSWQSYYNKDMAQIAAEVYHKDIKLFGYQNEVSSLGALNGTGR